MIADAPPRLDDDELPLAKGGSLLFLRLRLKKNKRSLRDGMTELVEPTPSLLEGVGRSVPLDSEPSLSAAIFACLAKHMAYADDGVYREALRLAFTSWVDALEWRPRHAALQFGRRGGAAIGELIVGRK